MMGGRYKTYPEYKDSGVEWLGEIPTDWKISKIKFNLSIFGRIGFRGYTVNDIVDEGEGALVLGPSNIIEDHFDLSQKKYLSWEKYYESPEIMLEYNDVLLVKTGSTYGKSTIVRNLPEPMTINPQMALLKRAMLNPVFISYLLNSKVIQSLIEVNNTGSGMPTMTQENINAFPVPVPPNNGADEIANFLDHETAKIDTLIEKQKQLIKLLKEKRQAVISHAVTKGLNPDVPMRNSGVEWLGEVPEHWEVKRIKNLSRNISKGTTPSTIGGKFVDSGIRFLKAENIGKSLYSSHIPKFFITKEVDSQISRSRLKKNDVLVIIAGATTGLSSIVSKEVLPANTNQAVSFIRPLKRQYSKLIVRWLSTEFAQRIIWMGAVQAAQPNLSMEDLGNIPIAVPPIEELNDIMDVIEKRLSEFDTLISKANSAISLIKERRTALISAAVTGKIDVRDWKAPTSVSSEARLVKSS